MDAKHPYFNFIRPHRWCSADILSNVTNFFKKAMTEKCLAEKFSPLLIATMSISSDDSKPHISVLHFSVIAFVQANLTFSSCFNHLDINQNKDKQLENFLIVLPSIVLPFEKLVTLDILSAVRMTALRFPPKRDYLIFEKELDKHSLLLIIFYL